jgi:hypothetical protein
MMSVLASKNGLKPTNLHFEKSFMKFSTNNKLCVHLNLVYGDKITKVVGTTPVLGLQIDYTFGWTMHNKNRHSFIRPILFTTSCQLAQHS